MIGTVRAGIEKVIGSTGFEIPAELSRFANELAVWSRNIDDPDVVQIMNHEEEATEWVRRLFPGAQKNFWLPHQGFGRKINKRGGRQNS